MHNDAVAKKNMMYRLSVQTQDYAVYKEYRHNLKHKILEREKIFCFDYIEYFIPFLSRGHEQKPLRNKASKEIFDGVDLCVAVESEYIYIFERNLGVTKKDKQAMVFAIKEIAKNHNAKIKIMHIMEKGEVEDFEEQNLALLKKELQGVKFSFNTMPFYDKKAEEIIDFISIAKIDFLVIEKNKHDFIEKIMREPIIEDVAKKIDIPLLVINH